MKKTYVIEFIKGAESKGGEIGDKGVKDSMVKDVKGSMVGANLHVVQAWVTKLKEWAQAW